MGITCTGYYDKKFKSIMKKLDNQMKVDEANKKSRKSDRKVQKDEYKEI